jgi:hypothetical protein
MREAHRYSNQTLQRAARHVRRALQHVPDHDRYHRLSMREKLDLLVCQLQRQGIQPNDLVRRNAEPALAAIASAIRFDRLRPPNVLPIGTIVVDSFAVHDEVTVTVEPPSKAWEHVIHRVLRMPSVTP